MVVNTPCIGVCSTVYGDAVCRGCKRLYHEVIAWNAYLDPEKQLIYQRLSTQIAQVLAKYLDITNEALLRAKVIQLQIIIRPDASLPEQAFHILRLGATKIKQTHLYGISVHPAFSHWPLTQLFNQIDLEVYQLACLQ